MRRCPSLFRQPSTSTFLQQTCLQWPLEKTTRVSSNLRSIEKYWNNHLEALPPEQPNHEIPSKYVLAMFPYPSGRLHMGHMRVYSISDVCSRYYTLNGFSVIHPIGWDAFGLPAENAAFQHGVDPKTWTYDNINLMRNQLKRIGIKFNWDREIFTCESNFFKWTQWIFLQMHKIGLVRRALAEVYWDPVDQTVLAAEQVDNNGRSWRSGAPAEKRRLRQWMVETPKFAKRMLDGLEALRYEWGEVADIQANWIGKCDVYRFLLPIKSSDKKESDEFLDLRLQNPMELTSAQFFFITPEHPLAALYNEKRSGNESYLLDETAFNFVTGVEMPIVVLCESDLVALKNMRKVDFFMNTCLANAHNCDFDSKIAQQFALKISPTVTKEAIKSLSAIQNEAQKRNFGGYLTSRTLRDWVVSRQRGWGTPIPMILDAKNNCKPLAVADHQLPVLSEQRGKKIPCEKFNGDGVYETDTLDTFFDSSWYFLRYLDPNNCEALVSPEIVARHMPVDIYVGGIEHADIHLFYARFVFYFLHDLDVLPHAEPFLQLIPQGIVRGKTFLLAKSDANASTIYVKADDVVETSDGQFKHKSTGAPVLTKYEKMSKSFHNGVDPIRVIEENSVDLTRLLLLDAASPRLAIDWGNSTKLKGLLKWIDRMAWVVSAYVEERNKFVDNPIAELCSDSEKIFRDSYNYFVRYISTCVEIVHVHSTAIARLQSMTNVLRKNDPKLLGQSVEAERCIHALVIMLQIFAPNLASEFWSALEKAPKLRPELWLPNASVMKQEWPKVDADAPTEIVVKVCGNSLRASVDRSIELLTPEEIINEAQQHHHAYFFQLINEQQLKIDSIDVNINSGLQVTLNIKMVSGVQESDIIDILQRVSVENVRQQKVSRRQRIEKHAAANLLNTITSEKH